MSEILCTFPGRAGDLLWALPTMRAISQQVGQPVDLQICGEFAGIVPLLVVQSYLARITADPDWGIGAGWRPPTVAAGPHDRIFHLGYRRWPELPLPVEIDQTVRVDIELPPLDLTTPWITVASDAPATPWICGFSECHFELKYGLWSLLTHKMLGRRGALPVNISYGPRWKAEGYPLHDWLAGAKLLAHTKAFLGDCSGWHVLAVAMGIPVVVMEPMEARWNQIFYPLGMDGPQVTLVRGLDGLPTFDSRHTLETLELVIAAGRSW